MQTVVYHEFDAFMESIHGVVSSMMYRNAERHQWSTTSVKVDNMELQLGLLGSGNIAQGQLQQAGIMVYLPLTPGVEYRANGTVVDRHAAVVMEPGCDFCISTQLAHDWCAISLPAARSPEDSEEESQSGARSSAECRVTAPDRRLSRRLWSIAQQVLSTATASDRFEASAAAQNAAKQMLRTASDLSGLRTLEEPRPAGRSRLPRREIIERALAQLDASGPVTLRVAELARAAGVSERTLRSVFDEYFGTGPVQYQLLRQLHLARRILRAADPANTTVSNVLTDLGIWSLSRFAGRYRQLFGELPHQTLHHG